MIVVVLLNTMVFGEVVLLIGNKQLQNRRNVKCLNGNLNVITVGEFMVYHIPANHVIVRYPND